MPYACRGGNCHSGNTEGVCGDHAGSRSLAHKAFRQGYYWPTLHQDAIIISRLCDKCQRYATIPHSPPEPLTPMISPWPFAQWKLDLIGPMPAGKGKILTRETPFSFAFGTDAVVLVELEQATFRVQNYVQSKNDKQLILNLDLVEEYRIQAHLRNVAYKQRISNYYDSKVKPRFFKVGDWVLKKRLLCDRVLSEETLSPNWDGPFEVVSISHLGSYKIRSSDGKTLGHPWNADHLKYYYK
ncbi:uncharacterized protein [Malus domestica]|uniref:uncharacterized protein n=1 Tax=Malus domestica TaxID=3750 RepID=UPI003975119B